MWTVIAVAVGIGAIALALEKWSSSLALALVALLLIGAIFPPAALLIGGVALFYLVFTNGRTLFGRFSAAVAAGGK